MFFLKDTKQKSLCQVLLRITSKKRFYCITNNKFFPSLLQNQSLRHFHARITRAEVIAWLRLDRNIRQNTMSIRIIRTYVPNPVSKLAGHYGFGDKNEADYYALFAQHVWQETQGAIEWLRKHSGKK